MIYLDTNVIISFMDERDINHSLAVKLFETLKVDRVVSRLVLLELASVYSRVGFEDPIALAIYSIDRVGARIMELDYSILMSRALVYAPQLRLKTLDLLHVLACSIMGADSIATFDRDIISRSSIIRNTLGIDVIGYNDL